jgi:phosphohistidine phosphatase SixA
VSRQLESYGINILKLHAEWLQDNGYKPQASSCRRQIRMILNNKKKERKIKDE